MLHELGDILELHTRTWLDWSMCTPSWIVSYTWYCAGIVALLYLAFAGISALLEKPAAKTLRLSGFFRSAAFVFFCCAFIHYIHAQSKYDPEVLVLSVFFYPILIVSMCFLLHKSVRLYSLTRKFVHADDVRTGLDEKQTEIDRLTALMDKQKITAASIAFEESQLSLLKTLNTIADEVVIEKGAAWQIPVFYNRWTRYSVSDQPCRLIGVYENAETTTTVNEIAACYFPPHTHAYTETVVVLKGEIEMNGETVKTGETVFFYSNQPHDLRTKGAVVLVTWNKKIDVIKGEV